jgi:IS5 family transposase
MMIDKADHGFSFVDAALIHAQARWNDHWLNKILQLVDWKPYSRDLDRLYSATEGRPGWDPVVLFRCLLLAEWNGLSDRQLEEALEFRIDFKKFAGMELDQGAPDATTFVVFRNRIQHLWKKLLRRLNAQLEDRGYSVKKAIAVDATSPCSRVPPVLHRVHYRIMNGKMPLIFCEGDSWPVIGSTSP